MPSNTVRAPTLASCSVSPNRIVNKSRRASRKQSSFLPPRTSSIPSYRAVTSRPSSLSPRSRPRPFDLSTFWSAPSNWTNRRPRGISRARTAFSGRLGASPRPLSRPPFQTRRRRTPSSKGNRTCGQHQALHSSEEPPCRSCAVRHARPVRSALPPRPPAQLKRRPGPCSINRSSARRRSSTSRGTAVNPGACCRFRLACVRR